MEGVRRGMHGGRWMDMTSILARTLKHPCCPFMKLPIQWTLHPSKGRLNPAVSFAAFSLAQVRRCSPSSCQALSIVSTFSTRHGHPITVKKLLTSASPFPILLAPLSISVLATICHLRNTTSFITASFLFRLLDRAGSSFNQHHHDLIRAPIILAFG